MNGKKEHGQKGSSGMPAFTIGSRGGSAPAASAGKRDKPQATSAGFPLIEGMIEKGDFEAFNQRYRQNCQRLERIAESDADPNRVAGARKALRALDRSVNLLEELMAIKTKMIAGDVDEDEEE